ncbi:hypothetical protein D9M69_651160 [compost metagenome]
MTYLNQVIQLYTVSYTGRAHGSPVNSGICSNTYMISQHHITQLGDVLVYTVLIRRKSESF